MKEQLEQVHLHPSTNTTDLLRGVTFLRHTESNMTEWNKMNSQMIEGEKLARKFSR